MIESNDKEIAIIFCPPYSKYKVQPSDISKCELVDCPVCKEKMWFSEKKKSMKELCELAGKDIFFGCYDCFEKEVNNNREKYIDPIPTKIHI